MTQLDDTLEEIYENSRKDPHKTLYLSVIFQAVLDATKPEKNNEKGEIKLLRDQANAWFFTSTGVTCENFEFICEHAGLSPKSVRKFAHHVINSDNLSYVRKKILILLG
jgi:hypothetical protein